MDLKKENGKYILDCLPHYQKKFPKPRNEYLEAPLTKCESETIDKLEIYPYRNDMDITKSSIKIYYYNVPTGESFRVDIKYSIERKGLFGKEVKKYWEVEVYRIISPYDRDRGMLTDRQINGTFISNEIGKIFGDNKINKKNLIEFLLKFKYTKYSKNKNLKIGGM